MAWARSASTSFASPPFFSRIAALVRRLLKFDCSPIERSDPREALVELVVVAEAPVGRLVPALPAEARRAPQLALDARVHDGLGVDRDREGDGELVPLKHDDGPVVGRVLEAVLEALFEVGGLRGHGEADRVFRLVVAEAAPGRVHVAEDDGPVLLGGDHVEAVRACRERLAADREGRRGREAWCSRSRRRARRRRRARARPRPFVCSRRAGGTSTLNSASPTAWLTVAAGAGIGEVDDRGRRQRRPGREGRTPRGRGSDPSSTCSSSEFWRSRTAKRSSRFTGTGARGGMPVGRRDREERRRSPRGRPGRRSAARSRAGPRRRRTPCSTSRFDVELGGPLGHVETPGDLLVREVVEDRVEHLPLTPSQALEAGGVRAAEPCTERSRRTAREAPCQSTGPRPPRSGWPAAGSAPASS